ncbi:asparaginase [Actinokineospora sp. NPDC004072]
MARVVVFSLGGTIAMGPGGGQGVVPALSAADLVAAVPGLVGVDLEVVDFRRVPGASVAVGDVRALAAEVEAVLAAGADGVVVTQGTDTIEETAFLLDLLHHRDEPVVVTGAMRNPTLAGADGPANLLAAVRTAASPLARGLGVVVVFADEIHAAQRVQKAHSFSVGAFRSGAGGPLGYVVEGEVRLINRPVRLAGVPREVQRPQVRVAVVPMVLGDTGIVLEAVADRVDGVVVAGFGAGHVPAELAGPLGELAGRMPVVLASRTGGGAVLASTYGFAGSESDLLGRGLISAGFLDAYKARVLLLHLLSCGVDAAGVRAVFGRCA